MDVADLGALAAPKYRTAYAPSSGSGIGGTLPVLEHRPGRGRGRTSMRATCDYSSLVHHVLLLIRSRKHLCVSERNVVSE
jgi:hypothetical protein